MRGIAVCVALVAAIVAPASPQTPPGGEEAARPQFADWLETVREEALARGITPGTLARALDGLEPMRTVIERDRTQRELILTVQQYVDQRVTRGVIRTARAATARHRTLLRRVERTYGVPPRVVVAVWALESNFGRFSGVRPTIQALATLAWDGRRGALFHEQLLTALGILDRGEVAPDQLRGSWAGAMGQVQFLPTSYVEFAQDFDGDGRKDIWNSLPDVFASIANYLKEHGWQPRRPWGVQARLPQRPSNTFDALATPRQTGCSAVQELSAPTAFSAWSVAGARLLTGPRDRSVEASLLRAGASSYLVTANYEALLAYNCSNAYALSVGRLADAVGAGAASPPRRRSVKRPRKDAAQGE